MALPPDKLSANYTLRCSAEGCGGETGADQNLGVGWTLGTIVRMDPGNPVYGRCPKCKRHNMVVVKVPAARLPKKPKGFTQVPTK